MKKFIAISFLSIIFSGAAFSEENTITEFEHFLADNQRITGEFQQTISSETGELIQSASGEFWVQQPNKFRWDYNKPYVQKIISNGSKVWIYDEDLEQLTIKKVSSAEGTSPLAIFDASKPLNESFIVEQLSTFNGISWIQLIPKAETSSFESIDIGLSEKQLKYMNMYDHFGQTTKLIFNELTAPESINQSVFEFSAPEGVDVFEE